MLDDFIKKIQEFSSNLKSETLNADVKDILSGKIPLNTLAEKLCKDGEKDPELVKYFVKQGVDATNLNSTMNFVCYVLKAEAGRKSSWQKEMIQRLEQQQSQISLMEQRIKDIEKLLQDQHKNTGDNNYMDTEYNYDFTGVAKDEQ